MNNQIQPNNTSNNCVFSSKYRASFTRFPAEKRKKFILSHCYLPISVGQHYHEAGRFEAALKLVNANFKKCTILIADTLQRYNFRSSSNISEQESYDMALKKGDEWLFNHSKIMSKLAIEWNISRWDSWTHHIDYAHYRKKIETIYNSDPLYKEAVKNCIDQYLIRKLGAGKIVNVQSLRELSCEYIKEECAALFLFASEKFNYEVYPSQRIEPMQLIHEKYIAPCYNEDRVVSVVLNFKQKMRSKTRELLKGK